MVGVLNGNQEDFIITNANGDRLTYYNQVNTPSQSYVNGKLVVTLNESGYYTINDGPEMAGFFDLTLSGTDETGSPGYEMFTGVGGLDVPTPPSASVAPEPASILMLGTGLMGAAMFLRKRSSKGLEQAS